MEMSGLFALVAMTMVVLAVRSGRAPARSSSLATLVLARADVPASRHRHAGDFPMSVRPRRERGRTR